MANENIRLAEKNRDLLLKQYVDKYLHVTYLNVANNNKPGLPVNDSTCLNNTVDGYTFSVFNNNSWTQSPPYTPLKSNGLTVYCKYYTNDGNTWMESKGVFMIKLNTENSTLIDLGSEQEIDFKMGLENGEWKIDEYDVNSIEIPYADENLFTGNIFDLLPGDNLKDQVIQFPPISEWSNSSVGIYYFIEGYVDDTLWRCIFQISNQERKKIGFYIQSINHNYYDVKIMYMNSYLDSFDCPVAVWNKDNLTLTFKDFKINQIQAVPADVKEQFDFFKVTDFGYSDIGVIKPTSNSINIKNGHLEVITNSPVSSSNKIATMNDLDNVSIDWLNSNDNSPKQVLQVTVNNETGTDIESTDFKNHKFASIGFVYNYLAKVPYNPEFNVLVLNLEATETPYIITNGDTDPFYPDYNSNLGSYKTVIINGVMKNIDPVSKDGDKPVLVNNTPGGIAYTNANLHLNNIYYQFKAIGLKKYSTENYYYDIICDNSKILFNNCRFDCSYTLTSTQRGVPICNEGSEIYVNKCKFYLNEKCDCLIGGGNQSTTRMNSINVNDSNSLAYGVYNNYMNVYCSESIKDLDGNPLTFCSDQTSTGCKPFALANDNCYGFYRFHSSAPTTVTSSDSSIVVDQTNDRADIKVRNKLPNPTTAGYQVCVNNLQTGYELIDNTRVKSLTLGDSTTKINPDATSNIALPISKAENNHLIVKTDGLYSEEWEEQSVNKMIYYVDQDNGHDAKEGLEYDTAFKTLSKAMNDTRSISPKYKVVIVVMESAEHYSLFRETDDFNYSILDRASNIAFVADGDVTIDIDNLYSYNFANISFDGFVFNFIGDGYEYKPGCFTDWYMKNGRDINFINCEFGNVSSSNNGNDKVLIANEACNIQIQDSTFKLKTGTKYAFAGINIGNYYFSPCKIDNTSMLTAFIECNEVTVNCPRALTKTDGSPAAFCSGDQTGCIPFGTNNSNIFGFYHVSVGNNPTVITSPLQTIDINQSGFNVSVDLKALPTSSLLELQSGQAGSKYLNLKFDPDTLAVQDNKLTVKNPSVDLISSTLNIADTGTPGQESINIANPPTTSAVSLNGKVLDVKTDGTTIVKESGVIKTNYGAGNGITITNNQGVQVIAANTSQTVSNNNKIATMSDIQNATGGGVTKVTAGDNISISPNTGVGNVTITSTSYPVDGDNTSIKKTSNVLSVITNSTVSSSNKIATMVDLPPRIVADNVSTKITNNIISVLAKSQVSATNLLATMADLPHVTNYSGDPLSININNDGVIRVITNSALSNVNKIATMADVTSASQGIPDAPSDHNVYGRKDAGWVTIDTTNGDSSKVIQGDGILVEYSKSTDTYVVSNTGIIDAKKGTGIDISKNINNVITVSNTGVTKIVAGSNININNDGTGEVTINSTGSTGTTYIAGDNIEIDNSNNKISAVSNFGALIDQAITEYKTNG